LERFLARALPPIDAISETVMGGLSSSCPISHHHNLSCKQVPVSEFELDKLLSSKHTAFEVLASKHNLRETPADMTIVKRSDQNDRRSHDIAPQKSAYEFSGMCVCSTGCNHQFCCVCEACEKHCCSGHLVQLFDMRLCPGCLPEVWAQIPEPDCQCTQTDVDVFSVRDCEIHNPSSEWNELRRAFRESEEDGEMKLRTTKRR
jgi:hypothetical protein